MNLGALPKEIPIVPLAEPLLLPGTVVPFVAKDEGERNLLRDAMSEQGYVGIVQPQEGDPEDHPRLYQVGCLGRIGETKDNEEGETVALAGGLVRFRLVAELPCDRGYRRARVDYSEFALDPVDVEGELSFAGLRKLVKKRIEENSAEFDLSIMDRMAGTEIVTAIAHAIPLSPAERQMLMETPQLVHLESVLLQLMAGPGGVPSFAPQSSLPS